MQPTKKSEKANASSSVRRGGLMVSALDSAPSGFEPWPGTLHCVILQHPWLLQCFSPPSCTNGTGEFNAMGNPCDGLVPHPRGVEIILAASCYKISSNQTVRKCFLSGYPFSLCVTRKQTKARVLFTTRQVHHYSFHWSFVTVWQNARNMLRPTMLRYVALTWCDHLARA